MCVSPRKKQARHCMCVSQRYVCQRCVRVKDVCESKMCMSEYVRCVPLKKVQETTHMIGMFAFASSSMCEYVSQTPNKRPTTACVRPKTINPTDVGFLDSEIGTSCETLYATVVCESESEMPKH